MKKFISKVVGTMLMFSLVLSANVTSSFAATSQSEAESLSAMVQATINSPEFIEKYSPYITTSENDGRLKAPAGPVTNLYVDWVYSGSTTSGMYTIDEEIWNNSQTNLDHSGYIYVATVKMGYGSDISQFNSSNCKLFDQQMIDLNNDRIVDGFYTLWEIAPNYGGSGNYKYSSTSYNSPWNTMSASLYIR